MANLQEELLDILESHSAFASEQSRRAVLLRSGLDKSLTARIDFSGSPSVFLTNLIPLLMDYGKLPDGRDALAGFLEACSALMGSEKRLKINEIGVHWSLQRKEMRLTEDVLAYLRFIKKKWNSVDSPLLPAECQLAEIVVPIDLIESGSKLRPLRQLGQRSLMTGRMNLSNILDSSIEPFRWVVLGDPGAGKSTLLLREASIRAGEALADPSRQVPILISLAAYGRFIAENRDLSIYDYFTLLGHTLVISNLGKDIHRLVRSGRILLFLDGLDEVADAQRPELIERIEAALADYAGNRVIITSRIAGYAPLLGYSTVEIAPLTIDHQRKLMLAICGEEKTKRLLAEISGRRELQDMVAIPMILTVMALVARESRQLEAGYFRRSSDLFRFASKILLEGRHRRNGGVSDPHFADRILAHVSFKLHQIAAESGDDTFSDTCVEEAVSQVDPTWLKPWKNPRAFIQDISVASNIIYAIDVLEQKYKYLHRTFREFFVAVQLSRWQVEDRRHFIAEKLGHQSWHQVMIILGGLVNDIQDYLRALLQGPPDLALRTLKEIKLLDPMIAAEVLQLRPMRLQSRRQIFIELVRKLPLAEHIVDVSWAYLRSAGKAIPRVDLYFIQEILRFVKTNLSSDLLGELFKFIGVPPRDLLHDLKLGTSTYSYWCPVPEGICLIGAPTDDPDRPPGVPTIKEVHISDFRIARVPVTNGLYKHFDPDHFANLEFADAVPMNELEEHPVVQVSWYEAEMFCQWLAQSYVNIRLPTEAEWEKAASWTGVKKSRFPWGDEWNPAHLNCWESGPNRTTRVGSYPAGISPFGALDMAGNVWEWCLDWSSENEQANHSAVLERDPIGPLTGSRRIDRGGGWYHDVGRPFTFLRAADDPGDSFSHCGLRILESEVAQDRGQDLFTSERQEAAVIAEYLEESPVADNRNNFAARKPWSAIVYDLMRSIFPKKPTKHKGN